MHPQSPTANVKKAEVNSTEALDHPSCGKHGVYINTKTL